MSESTFITRVVLENYKSVASCDVQLGPLMFLVGPNGAGKSNFLDALRFVADALKHSVEHALQSRGGGPAICYAPHQRQAAFSIHLEFVDSAGKVGHYTLRVGAPADASLQSRWQVLEEIIGLPTAVGDVGSGIRSRHQPRERAALGNRLALAFVSDEPDFRQVYEKLTRMLFYNIQPHLMREGDVVTFDPAQFLPADGSNVASVLFRLGMASQPILDRINEFLRLILPGLVQTRVEPVLKDEKSLTFESQKVALLFEQQLPGRGVHLFWPSQMSDGTLRALGILTALLQATVEEGPRPSLVAIEEPEAQIHPAALAVLLDAMRGASYSTQVLVTTQSSDLLDDKHVKTESVLAVNAERGHTCIGPIDEASRSVLQRRLFTVGELLRIGQLSPETDRCHEDRSANTVAPEGQP